MKNRKTRTITIPDRVITKKEYDGFLNFSIHSSEWYATNWLCSEKMILDRLYKKGFTDKYVKVQELNGIIEKNIIEETIKYLKKHSIIDDKHFAESKNIIMLRQNKGENYIKNYLRSKGIATEIIDNVLSNNSYTSSIEKIVKKLQKSSTYIKKDDFQKKQYLYSTLLRKGFSINDIQDCINNLF